jgi:hypothetical protein
MPFVVLTNHNEGPRFRQFRSNLVRKLRNIAFLERPMQAISLQAAVLTAQRGRARQYEARAYLEAQQRTAEELERLVGKRTAALKEANDRLQAESDRRERAQAALLQAQKQPKGDCRSSADRFEAEYPSILSRGFAMGQERAGPVRFRQPCRAGRIGPGRGAPSADPRSELSISHSAWRACSGTVIVDESQSPRPLCVPWHSFGHIQSMQPTRRRSLGDSLICGLPTPVSSLSLAARSSQAMALGSPVNLTLACPMS